MPFEPKYSDGLHTGGTLDFLVEKGFIASVSSLSDNASVGMNGLVAVQLKTQDATTLVLQLRSTSALSTMEYLPQREHMCESEHETQAICKGGTSADRNCPEKFKFQNVKRNEKFEKHPETNPTFQKPSSAA